MRRMRRGVIALVSLLALVAGGSVDAHKGPHKRLEAIENKIALNEKRIEEAEEERRGLLDEVADADRDRQALAGEIELLNGDLEEARGRLAVVRARLDAARMALIETTEELQATRDQLREQQETLDSRASTAYRLGPAVYLDVLLGSDDFRSLADRSAYLERVLTIDSDLVVGLQTTRSLVADQKELVADVEGELSEQWDQVHAEVERIATLKAEQQALQSQIEQEITVREGLIEDIEETRAEYEAAVAELQGQSDRIRAALQSGGSTGSGQTPGGGQLFWPTSGSIGSGYGWRTHPIFGTQRFHSGVDIGGACGQPIWAAEDGQVISAGYNGGYGNATVIDHGGGLATLYAHQSSFAVSSGQSVSRGQTIGYVGTTGWSTGCHLHFEVRVNGSPVDPVPYLT